MFFPRRQLKREARQSMKGNYLPIGLVFLLSLAIGLLVLILPSSIILMADALTFVEALIAIIWMILLPCIIFNIIPFSWIRFFLAFCKNKNALNIKDFWEGWNFTIPSILCGFWTELLVNLWSILLIIPGFIKFYAYSQAFFVLADHPAIGVINSVEISKTMTRGHKWELFLLDLSFFGWPLLGMVICALLTSASDLIYLMVFYLICGLLYFCILPYYFITKCNVYLFLRQEVIENGEFLAKDFGLTDETISD